MVSDQYTDRSFRVLHRKLQEFPSETKELIKSASIDYEEVDSLPSTAFAWPEMRKFAMHTKEHAVLSKIYSNNENVPNYVSQNLDRALSLYQVNLPNTVKVAAEKVENIGDYLVPHLRFGKITDSESVKEASRFFVNNSKKMDMETRVNAAVTLVKKAAEHKTKIPSSIYKHAGLTVTNCSVLVDWIEARKYASTNDMTKVAYEKLGNLVKTKQELFKGRRELMKLADALYDLDKKSDLVKKYDQTLPDPILTVFNTSKLAEETVTLAGKDIPLSKLISLPAESYGDALGEDIIPEIVDSNGNVDEVSLKSVLVTLPADMQISLVKNLGL